MEYEIGSYKSGVFDVASRNKDVIYLPKGAVSTVEKELHIWINRSDLYETYKRVIVNVKILDCTTGKFLSSKSAVYDFFF